MKLTQHGAMSTIYGPQHCLEYSVLFQQQDYIKMVIHYY